MFSIGFDIAADSFDVRAVDERLIPCFGPRTFAQNALGWQDCAAFFQHHHLTPANSRVVMEATGVYAEGVSVFFYRAGFPVYVEPPHKIRRGFYERGKTDPVDARQIAEYGVRFADRLHPWRPKPDIVDKVQCLLTAREHLVKTRTACKNLVQAVARKPQPPDAVPLVYADILGTLKTAITQLDAHIQTTLMADPAIARHYEHVVSIPRLGWLFAANLCVVTEGFTQHLDARSLAAYIGICPFEHQSGTSVWRRPSADHAGPARLRKLLYLASMRYRHFSPEAERYFLRKVAEGKAPKLVLNNLANKLLRIACGVILSGKPYISTYRSPSIQKKSSKV